MTKPKFKKGDLIYYIYDDYEGHKGCSYGIVIKIKGENVLAHWREYNGEKLLNGFESSTGFMPIEECTLEPDWSKIKGFKNIPKIANVPKFNNQSAVALCEKTKKKPRKWTVDTTVKSDDNIKVSKEQIFMPQTGDLGISVAKTIYKQLGAALKIHKRYFHE